VAVRSAFDNLRREARVSMFGRLVGRLFSRNVKWPLTTDHDE
jgi:hypothetical protein